MTAIKRRGFGWDFEERGSVCGCTGKAPRAIVSAPRFPDPDVEM
ncbi:MAG: hypothetical protein AAFP99_12435 [Pseudomonadota bacterium]